MADSDAAPEHDPEAALLSALRAGEASAYERLVRSHGGPLLAVCRRILRDEEDAREAVQEAFLSAFRGIAEFSGRARLGTWLHRIAVNACLMRLRSRRRHPEQPIEELLPRFEADGHFARWPVDWAEPADALLARREARESVRACLDRLPESHRTVLLLRDIEELDTAETARALGLSVAAVKVRLHRARQALRTLLEAEFGRAGR